MHIGIVGPIDTATIADLIGDGASGLPQGYSGAPLLGTLIRELLKRGHRVSAFTLSRDMPLVARQTVVATRGNFSIEYCPMRPRAWSRNGAQRGRILDFYRFERLGLEQAMRRVAPDVIHAHWAYEFALAAIATEHPHVITCHDSPIKVARMNSFSKPTISGYRWLRVFMARDVLRRARCVTAVSPYMRNAVQRVTSVPIAVVPNPVENLAVTCYRARTAPVAPRLAMVCNGWGVGKNAKPALRAFALLKEQNPAAELHLYGHGFGAGEAGEHWCRSRKIQSGMSFHGPVPHHQLLQAFTELDLLVHPSLEESFGMVIAEAMAIGLPVVGGQSSGAVPWVLQGAGALCDVRDAGAIFAAIQSLLVPANFERASKLGHAYGRDRFGASKVTDDYLAVYARAVTERSTRQC